MKNYQKWPCIKIVNFPLYWLWLSGYMMPRKVWWKVQYHTWVIETALAGSVFYIKGYQITMDCRDVPVSVNFWLNDGFGYFFCSFSKLSFTNPLIPCYCWCRTILALCNNGTGSTLAQEQWCELTHDCAFTGKFNLKIWNVQN